MPHSSATRRSRLLLPLLMLLLISLRTARADDECRDHQWGRLANAGPMAVPEVGDIVCRSNGTSRAVVGYYSCKEMADFYLISVERFFMLNPLLKEDCSNIEPNKPYCVAGFKQPPLATDGKCGPLNGNATCSGTEKQCCNAETWTCGDTEADCAPGNCHSGACEGGNIWSLDGRCGWRHRGLGCAGRWGDCCNLEGLCGTGDEFCGVGNCDMGNCTKPDEPLLPIELPWPSGNTPDGTCGGESGYTCNVVWGNCCGAAGRCGSSAEFCGAGCQSKFGQCGTGTSSTASPTST
ncbi:uncharacterized protein CTRU02_209488 [Colletotrichum truncatum]|uniref:Uncharacterized protein n=1 Tax=Colletotrichum truncatum TaxID=5467 RepID=A0ACC3YST4_COLTU|nr:uncharacterized protein CTRU02_08434 [Colletotrichum truncatum]KAF6789735.1 hypothetical protein CTRU02_08434 [Colletotrichum truncatum]